MPSLALVRMRTALRKRAVAVRATERLGGAAVQGTVGQLRCAGRGRTAGADAPPCCISRAARDTIRTTPRCPRVAVGPRLHRGTQQAPAELGEMLSTLHGAAGCGGLLAAALREGRPPPRAAAKRSAATSQRGWRVGVPLPCTAVSGLPPLELPPGRHRWAAAAGHLRPGVVCGVSLSSPVTVVKDIKRLIARRRRRGRRHGPGKGGGFTWADGDRTSIELHVWRFRWARRMRI